MAGVRQWGLDQAVPNGGFIHFPISFKTTSYINVVTHFNAADNIDPRAIEITYSDSIQFWIRSDGYATGNVQYYYLTIGR